MELLSHNRTCFGPTKRKWESKLNEHINLIGTHTPVNNAKFTNLLSSIWRDGFTKTNVVKGFESTGEQTKIISLRLIVSCQLSTIQNEKQQFKK